MDKKVVLMILDGWGSGKHDKADAIYHAKTPRMDALMERYPHTELLTDGENVGLPQGQMGNSEVGHLNIGAGRIIYQDLVKINKEIESKSIAHNEILLEAFEYAKTHNKTLHLLGLVSDGGVHSSQEHLHALCDLAVESGLKKVLIHALTDGRDTDPRSGLGFMKKLQNHIKNTPVKIASLIGRYYTMDRDKRWERIKVGYDLLVHAKGNPSNNLLESIQNSYDEGVTDEFIKPIVMVDSQGIRLGKVEEGDVVLCFNFRTDRLREITQVLTQEDMPQHGMTRVPLHYVTMTPYDETFRNVKVVYPKDNVTQTLGQTLSEAGKKQIRIAETEKYAHVTFFFNGGREEVFPGEKRILIPSPKVATYDLKPSMSALEIKDAIIPELKKQEVDFVCLNFANGDMVGHTGVWDAIIEAVETVDRCVGEVVDAALENDYQCLIIADHGNADHALNTDGSPNTAHSLNPVPCVLVGAGNTKLNKGVLADVAPTILQLMDLSIPAEMTGKPLILNE